MERVELGEQRSSGDGRVGSDDKTRNDDDNNMRLGRRICLGFLVVLILVVIGGAVAYFLTRPEWIEVEDSTQMETLPSLIKVAPIGGGGVLIQFTQLLEDPSQLFYYVEMQDVDIQSVLQDAGGNDEDLDKLSLYLTRPKNPTAESLSKGIKIENVTRVIESPYRLPESFIPGDYNGVVLAKETDVEARTDIVSRTAFDVVVDPDRNVAGAPTAPTAAPTAAPTTRMPVPVTASPTPAPTKTPTTRAPVVPPDGPTLFPTNGPTKFPTTSPTKVPTRAPVAAPTSPPLPPVLESTLESDDYNIAGTIVINYVATFVGGNVVNRARLQFDIPEATRAPGPYLYLSPRPYSETYDGDLLAVDVFIPIDQTNGGSFTVEGKYDQFLDEISDINDVNDYTNGSWIVWCRNFDVWLGGGPISVQQ